MSENDEGFRPGLEVAVIGMAGRFPRASNIEHFWNNLINGSNSITFFSDEELLTAGVDPKLIKNSNYVKAKGFVEGMEYFDPSFFGYTPKEAETLDPQIRIFHECVWEGLEDAGYNPKSYEGLIGLYGGGAGSLFWEVLANIKDTGWNYIRGADILGNKDFLCTQISYKQNLTGPSFTLYTACSTSLVAIHLACQAVLGGECDIALAGGVSIIPPKESGYTYVPGMLYSSDGYCRTFDAKASGTLFTNGAGIVVLKRLEEAIADGDNIYAVVKGTAINNDGKRKVGYTAPSAEGQRDVIRAALQVAEVEPESITYLEAHGTGTIMGDPIEIEALKEAYNTNKKGYCRLGTVKTNVGHMDAAAGVAGFIKAVLALKHKVIPPSLHFENPNPKIDFENSPFIVNTGLTEWKSTEYPLRAGVSSFGIGGTNAHAILEEAPGFAERETIPPPREYQLILLSAQTESSLEQMTRNLADHFKKNPGINLADAAYTLKVGRRTFNHRRMLVCPTNNIEEAIEILSSPTSGKLHTAIGNDARRSIVFMFPGQGSQYINMGLDLYRTEPVFRTEANRCFDILKPLIGYDIKEILYPTSHHSKRFKALHLEKGLHSNRFKAPHQERGLHTDRFEASPLEKGLHTDRIEVSPFEKGLHTVPTHPFIGDPVGSHDPAERINQTGVTQPLIFIFEYALAKLLIQWGIQPDAMIGHSIGEYAAACLSGLFSLENVLKLVAARGKLMQEIPGGAMLSIPLSEEKLTPLLNDQLALAAVNAPSLCVVSGTYESIDTFEAKLKEKGIKSRRLHTSHAFHSKMMDPVLKAFEESVSQEGFGDLNIPYISNVTGDWISAEEAANPTYWSRHLRGTVKFADGIKELLKKQDSILIEVGPGRALSTFAKQQLKKESGQVVLNLIRHPQENVSDIYYILERIGQLWLYGIEPDWTEFYSREKRTRVSLPTYAFDRQRYWLEGDPLKMGIKGTPEKQLLQKNPDINEWFYMPSWQRLMLPTGNQGETQENTGWLFFTDECGLGTRLAAQLQADHREAVLVKKGEKFCDVSDKEYIINPSQEKDYEELLNTLTAKGPIPRTIVHLWNVTDKISHQKGFQWAADVQNLGYYSLVNLAKAIDKLDTTDEFQVTVVTNHVQEVTGKETLCPAKATLLGPVKVIPQEFQNMSCRCVDIDYPGLGDWQTRKLIIQLLAEFKANAPDQLIAYRGNYRLVQSFTPLRLDDPGETTPRLKEKGCYLVTGGLGGIGLEIAQHLAEHVHARLVLTGRSELPPKHAWEEWLRSHPHTDTTSVKIRKVQKLEERGAEVITASADVSNIEQMKKIIQQTVERFGNINGIIHSAGVPDGAVIKRRTREITESITAPKVKGTLVLEQILQDLDIEPDFFILCSSVSSILAPFGQVGYAGANAFLDTFAHYKTSRDGTFCVSINWDTWQEVGMAVTAAKEIKKMIDIPVSPSEEVAHPFLDRKASSSPGQGIYSGNFSVNKTWVLDEHRIMGKPTVPGTTWLEVIRAAFEDHMTLDMEMEKKAVEISEMFFLVPLIVEENEEKEVRVILNKQGNGFDFVIRSRINSTGDEWVDHAKGHITWLEQVPRVIHRLEELENRCSEHEVVLSGDQSGYDKGVIRFGPRWKNLKWLKSGSQEWLALLELPQAFSHDSQFLKLHPALMDAATSFMAANETSDESILYLPFCYNGLKIKKPLPRKIYSYVKQIDVNKSQEELMRFNIHIMDEHGRELVEVEEFTLKKVSSQTHTAKQLRGESSAGTTGETLPAEVQEDLLKFGLLPSEGVEAYRRVMGAQVPQVCVSTRDLVDLVSYTDASGGSPVEMSLEKITPSRSKISRSGLNTPYVTPSNKTEKILAEIWEKFFGITEVGVHDNFFELGGDSLKAVTIEAEIRKKLDIKLPLEEFFTRPTIGGLAQYIDESSSQDISVEIEPVEKRRYYELSSAQKRLYFLNQLDSSSTNYNQPHYLLLEGEIQKDLVEEIFKNLIKRHESLRTSFEMVDGKVMQKIHDNVDFELEYYQSEGTIEDALKGFIRPFDFSKACQFRAGLIKMGESKYILIIDIHHIVADAFAFIIFTREFEALYRGEELPQLKIQYKDYAEWQNRESVKDALKTQEEYWLKELGGVLPVLHMPIDFPRPPAQSFEGNSIMIEIGSKESRALNKLAIEENATLFMVLLAAYNILLSKLSGQQDIMVGSVIEGRRHEDFRKIIGMFVNTLVLMNQPLENYTFKDFLQDVRRKTLEVFENQDYQFESLVEKLSTNRDTSRNPLFDAAFTLQNSDKPQRATESEGFGIKARYSEYEKDTTMFDLSLIAEEIGGNLQLTWTYCTRLFKASTIEKFATHFKEIISVVLENKNIKLKDIKISHRLLSAKSTETQMDLGF